MPFSSVVFVFAFLPVFLTLYYVAPARLRNFVALLGSLAFYAWGAPRFLVVLIAISIFDYVISKRIAASEQGARRRVVLLVVALSVNLSLLFYFKYANFAVHELNGLLGARALTWEDVALPMGISFIVFEEISYLVDVYRGTSAPARRFSDYALFLSLFPHAIAGPIFRWKDLEGQLRERRHSLEQVFDGFLRFSLGMAKKVLIANNVASVADRAFALDLQQLPTAYAWVGIVAYSLQIYFDFSGYSDMAIGLGKMIGFSFKENFDAPYSASSITDFWRRWHISLSTWLRDYLYIPLGGNRVSPFRRYRNLVLVFLVCGFWHGANWTFLAWGAYHGAWLIIERIPAWGRVTARLPRVLMVPVTFVIVMFGWVLFRADTLPHALGYMSRLVSWHSVAASGTITSWGELMTNRALIYGSLSLLACFASAFGPVNRGFAWLFGKGSEPRRALGRELLRYGLATSCFALAVISLVSSKFNPFIYFRF